LYAGSIATSLRHCLQFLVDLVLYRASLTDVLSVFLILNRTDREIDNLLTYGPEGEKINKQSKRSSIW